MGKKTEPELDEEGNPIPPQHQETDPEGDNHIDDDDTLGKFKKIRENYESKLSDVLNICLTNIHFKQN